MIAVDHLTRRCGTVAAVDGLGFEVRQPNGPAIARRAVVLAGRRGTGDDRYSRRVGSRGRRGPGWPGADAGQVAGPVVVPGPGRPDVPAQTSRRADGRRRARRAGRVRAAATSPRQDVSRTMWSTGPTAVPPASPTSKTIVSGTTTCCCTSSAGPSPSTPTALARSPARTARSSAATVRHLNPGNGPFGPSNFPTWLTIMDFRPA